RVRREGDSRKSDREGRLVWSRFDRDPSPGGGAYGGPRARHRRFTETTLDIVRWSAGHTKYTAHPRAAPARSDVRSAPERSALPKTLRRETKVNSRNFFAELKRRNVLRMGGLYLVGAWLVVQVAGTVLPMFGAPEWLPRTIVVLLAIGFVPAVIFSWAFELTPQGLKREEDVAPEQSITPRTGRRMDRMIIVVLVLALGYFAFDKFVLTPRREAALVASAVPNESKSVINAKSIAVLPF